jgi:multidrug efflux system membrane fusion protein
MSEQLEAPPSRARTDTTKAPVRHKQGWGGRIAILIVIVATALIGWRVMTSGGSHPAGRTATTPPQPVGVATVTTGDLDVVQTGLGSVTPLATVTVRTQINGQLQQIPFTEGELVHKGDFLAQIDPRPYQVALEQAQGIFAKDSALLAQAKADNARYQLLQKQDSISRQQAEDQIYLVHQYEGTVITDQAAIDAAKLNLVYCHIVSPVDGRVGIRMVDVGNYVQTSDVNGIVVVTQLQPISVLFTLPEDVVGEVQAQAAKGPLQVVAYDRTNTKPIATGTLAAIDSQIDPTTGTVKLRAMFPNTDNALFPQQFVNAHLLVETLKNVVVVPQAAVQHGAPGDFVYVVKPDKTVGVQVVKLGVSDGVREQIVDGLKPGAVVVTDGLDRLRDGAPVVVAPAANGAQPAAAAGAPDSPAAAHRHGHRPAGTESEKPAASAAGG